MPTPSHRVIRAGLSRPRVHAVLLLEQIRHGQRLLGDLGRGAPAAAGADYLPRHAYNQPLRTPQRPRARQNVIFELAFSIAHLGRERVCALYEDGVELPSDFRGVEYQPFDGGGAWKSKLARELHAAGLGFDPLNLL